MTSGDLDLDRFRTQIGELIDRFISAKQADFAHLSPDAEELIEEARAVTAGGKRLRAAFVFWGYCACSSQDGEQQSEGVLAAAAALELLHASALVHDDVMDASLLRRGRPATHRLFADRLAATQAPGDPDAYGNAAAILLGDLLLSWADELLHRALDRHPAAASSARSIYEATKDEVILGQFLDVSVQARGAASLDEAMRVLRYKSAKYSVERPLHLGAALADASADHLAGLSEFGVPIGEAFQLRDDLLGVFGDPEITGKPAGDDLVEGKRTVLVALALAGLEQSARAELQGLLGRPLHESELARARELLVASGAVDDVETLIEQRREQALTALGATSSATAAVAALRELAYAATARSS